MSQSSALPLELAQWLREHKHLPQPLRDFHDQKALFQAMHSALPPSAEADLLPRPDWVAGQCYVIDVFLRYMAEHGYTLQRSRSRHGFKNLKTSIRHHQDQRAASFRAMVQNSKTTP